MSALEEDNNTVMLVDDDVVFVETLGRALVRRGYAVTICTSVEHAKQTLVLQAPSLAVIDLRLPDGSGLGLVGNLKERNPNAAIVVLTGFGSIASAVEAVKLGATNYLCKPVDADAVVAALNSLAPEAAAPAAAKQPLTVMRLEWEHINRVLVEHEGNISATARALNMHRRTLQRKLMKHPVKH